jgi:hypothetical protein
LLDNRRIRIFGTSDERIRIQEAMLRIKIRDPEWMGEKTESGSGMNNPDHFTESLETNFLG